VSTEVATRHSESGQRIEHDALGRDRCVVGSDYDGGIF
jgi:hypothetical protein